MEVNIELGLAALPFWKPGALAVSSSEDSLRTPGQTETHVDLPASVSIQLILYYVKNHAPSKGVRHQG